MACTDGTQVEYNGGQTVGTHRQVFTRVLISGTQSTQGQIQVGTQVAHICGTHGGEPIDSFTGGTEVGTGEHMQTGTHWQDSQVDTYRQIHFGRTHKQSLTNGMHE